MNGMYQNTAACLSTLLRYPEADFRSILDEVRTEYAKDMPDAIRQFVAQAYNKDTMALQGAYLESFDFNKNGSLHLISHIYRDSSSQGRALAGLNAMYSDAGFTPLDGELPDYLPLILEFLSVGPNWTCTELCGLFAPAVGQVSRHLEQQQCVYTPLVRCAESLFTAELPQS